MPKRKLYRCKLCDHETTERVDKWQHIKTHVTPDKLLTCNSCPFVTEYKHHLEYHQRNHNGVKPFKCEQCDYRCVNRSMLKSHSKSHSSVCPYQCGECRYATKYAHSLKMHLKKYCHNQQLNGSLSIVTSSSPLCKVEKDLSQKHLILTSDNKHGASSTSPAYSSSATSTTSSSPISSITPTSLTPTSATIPNSAREPNLDILDLRIRTKTQAGKT